MKTFIYSQIALATLFAGVLIQSLKSRPISQAYRDCKMRKRLKEEQIDQMIDDSFPASDPPSTY